MQTASANQSATQSANHCADRASHLIHKNFLAILIAAYFLAGICPQLGQAMRHVQFGAVHLGGGDIKITLSLLMLAFLLFNAGLGIKVKELKGLVQKPALIIVGFLANMAIPLILIGVLYGLMQCWHDSDELQNLLVGLALIVAMPIAGSSTAWSQNANGNLSLSLGLVFLSTIFSPFTTPILLHYFAMLTAGDYSSDLRELAAQGTNVFMMLTVVLPSVAGIITHFILGEARTQAVKPYLKLLNFIVLLLLNYVNATTSLPAAIARPDPDFLVFIVGMTALLCATAFGAGWLIARWFKTGSGDRASLMFGLGMNNNGTGLVLAAATLSDHPAVMLPMIFYTLIQQVFAALVDLRFFSKAEADC